MSAAAFLKARDFLFTHRSDYDTAYREFRWPVLDKFNWALDYFDPMADGNDKPALWIVNEGGGEAKISFAEMAERSNRVANHLRGLGIKRGDRILLMLGNVAPLWEVMLAAMKLGAVTIPASTLLNRDDLIDRFDRGRVRQILNNLVINALEALDGVATPRLELATRFEQAAGDARYAIVTVCDNGPGFQRELLGRVFDPYVTSKPKGTGLGLAIVKKIVEEHGGRIDADNRPEGGARIRVVLPMTDSTRSASGIRERRAELRREIV